MKLSFHVWPDYTQLCLNVLMLLIVRNPINASICVSSFTFPESWGESQLLTVFVLMSGVFISSPSPSRAPSPLSLSSPHTPSHPPISTLLPLLHVLILATGSCFFLITESKAPLQKDAVMQQCDPLFFRLQLVL